MNDDLAIGLLGDVMLGRKVGEQLADRAPASLWAPELRELAASLDAVVANLECCISDRGEPTARIPGKPFFFRAPPTAVEALRAMNVRAVSLANNHALDFGADALADTLGHLAAAGIAAAGAGLGSDAARAPTMFAAGARRVALVAATDHPDEYAAGPDTWGVALAPLTAGPPDWLRRTIADARRDADLAIAFLHWGPNMNPATAAWQQGAARVLQAVGAGLVAGHSAHVFHGVGWTADGPALYDLGDALDDYRIDPGLRNDLGVFAIWRPYGDGPRLELVGLRLEYAFTGLATGEDADWIAARLRRACAALGTRAIRLSEQRFAIEPLQAPQDSSISP